MLQVSDWVGVGGRKELVSVFWGDVSFECIFGGEVSGGERKGLTSAQTLRSGETFQTACFS